MRILFFSFSLFAFISPLTASDSGGWPKLREADWKSYGYELSKEQTRRNFYADLVFKSLDDLAALDLRIPFCVQNQQDYYFAELAGGFARLGKVELGIERYIGTATKLDQVDSGPARLRLLRQGGHILLALNHSRVAGAFDETYKAGKIGIGAIGRHSEILSTSLRPLPEVFFTDDFMRSEEEQGQWTIISGEWKVSSIENSLRSINAFSFQGKAKKGAALAVAGYSSWNDYLLRLACKPQEKAAVGVAFCFIDESNYHLFRWEGGAKGKCQIIEVRDGKRSSLMEFDGGFQPGVWYQIEVMLSGDSVNVSIDGHSLPEARYSKISYGRIGLYSESDKGCLFDDVSVGPVTSQSFNAHWQSDNRWQAFGGSWNVSELNGNFAVDGKATTGGKFLCMSSANSSIVTTAKFLQPFKGTAGLAFCYEDEGNYYSFELSRSRSSVARLIKTLDGKRTELSSSEMPDDPEQVSVSAIEGILSAWINGKKVLDAPDSTFRSGRAGLLLGLQSDASFSKVSLRSTPAPAPVLKTNKIFSKEKSMSNWADPESDWIIENPHDPGNQVWMHRMDFKGDTWIQMNLNPSSTAGRARLFLCGEKGIDSGYRLELGLGTTRTVKLLKENRVMALNELQLNQQPGRLTLRRSGNLLVGYVDGKRVVSFQDEQPLKGERVGWSAWAGMVRLDDVQIFNENIYSYTFEKAPVDWRPAAGSWEVTNRWQCDPRWSWFSGREKRGAAVLWNKRMFHGDLSVEFIAAPKMDRTRGDYTAYVRDMNLTICADGRNLDSGYTFVFGGWGNTRTAILRGREVLAESASQIIAGSLHRHWFKFNIEKRGGRIKFVVDGRPVLECDDPNPLTGSHIALWTYRSGMMVSRLRVSSLSGKSKERPAFTGRRQVVTFYGN